MGIKIEDFTPPAKPRQPNEYDPTIEELAEFEPGTKAATISEPVKDFAKTVRKFREAAKHAGYATRERTRVEDEKAGTITASYTIKPRKAKLEDSAEDDAEVTDAD